MFGKITKSKLSVTIVAFVGLYLLSVGTSWGVFSFLSPNSATNIVPVDDSAVSSTRTKIKNAPKTEACPINGMMYSKDERAIWEGRRPIAAMIENHADSRPSQGLSRADVVYEAVAEGGITRFMGVFYCGASGEETIIAPVRSSRMYFIDWASEYGQNPIYMHVGGANDYAGYGDTARDARALETLASIGWRVPKGNDFDTTYDSSFPVFYRDPERLGKTIAYEHQMVANLDKAYTEAEKRGFGAKDKNGKLWSDLFIPWIFTDNASSKDGGSQISFSFWTGVGQSDYDVSWMYDSGKAAYLRSNGGQIATDKQYNNVQLSATNVVIQFVTERGPVDRNKHMLYTTTGTGKALVFAGGGVTEATWSKKSRTDRTKFVDKSGKEISFVRGTIWIEEVPTGNKIDYK